MPNSVLIMPRPNEKQRLALTEKHRYVGYGGSPGRRQKLVRPLESDLAVPALPWHQGTHHQKDL